jgi:O-antigen/teichoic acid export membrane protein
MIPVAWFSGHHRFSLIAAGQQRWEFRVSAATGVATVIMAIAFVFLRGSVGAAVALLTGGLLNAWLAILACDRVVARVSVLPLVRPIALTCGACLLVGVVASRVVGDLAGGVLACLVYAGIMTRENLTFLRPRLMRLGRKLGLLHAR